MIIKKVKIVHEGDISENGMLDVIDADTEDPMTIFYTTPFGATKHGGFVAIPIFGQLCLACSPDGSDNSWYYMSSIYGKDTIPNVDMGEDVEYYSPGDLATGDKDTTLPKKSNPYNKLGIPDKYSWITPAGNGIELRDGNASGSNPAVTLKSQKGKIIQLNDGFEGDAIVIQNEHGDRISINNRFNCESGARGITLICKGNIHMEASNESLNLKVVQGKEIHIENFSHNANQAANINITSHNGDVNLNAYGKDSEINLITKHTTAPINLKSGGDINLEAEGSVNIKSKGDICLASIATTIFESPSFLFNNVDLDTAISSAAADMPMPLLYGLLPVTLVSDLEDDEVDEIHLTHPLVSLSIPFPFSPVDGIATINDSEIITYKTANIKDGILYEITRGAYGTKAEKHSAMDSVYSSFANKYYSLIFPENDYNN